jgi:hypothetical protein
MSATFGLGQRRQQQTGKDGYNGNNDEKLNERKS